MNQCAVCEADLPPKAATGRPRIFCSGRRREAARYYRETGVLRSERKRTVGSPKPKPVVTECLMCGPRISPPWMIRKAVFERDGFVCWLCGDACDPLGDPKFRPTVDHVIPFSKGGKDTADNLRTAHKSCNSRRGNRDAV